VTIGELPLIEGVEISDQAAELLASDDVGDRSAWAAQVVEQLEEDSGKPVVAYTHACFFVAFRTMGVNDAIRGHGRLLASLAN
jgi:hypothetical protein